MSEPPYTTAQAMGMLLSERNDLAAYERKFQADESRRHSEARDQWNWFETRRLCDREPTLVRGSCRHTRVVDVRQAESLGGEVVARLCLTCDAQLPA